MSEKVMLYFLMDDMDNEPHEIHEVGSTKEEIEQAICADVKENYDYFADDEDILSGIEFNWTDEKTVVVGVRDEFDCTYTIDGDLFEETMMELEGEDEEE